MAPPTQSTLPWQEFPATATPPSHWNAMTTAPTARTNACLWTLTGSPWISFMGFRGRWAGNRSGKPQVSESKPEAWPLSGYGLIARLGRCICRRLRHLADVHDQVPHVVVLGAALRLGRHLVLAVADDGEQILIGHCVQRVRIGPVGELQSHAAGQVGLAISVVPVAHRAVNRVKFFGLRLRFGGAFHGLL